MSEKNKAATIISPVGIARFPKLNEPDTKFKQEGEYSVKLVVPAQAAQPLIEQIDAALAASLAQAKKDNPKKAKGMKQAPAPYSEVTNDAGEETGEIVFTFKMRASGVSKRSGKPWSRRPALFDAKGKVIDPTKVQIGGGSKLKVAFVPVPYYTDLVGAGVTLRLEAVQVLELRQWNDRKAESFGFGKEEGYDSENAESAEVIPESTNDELPPADADDAEGDF